MLKATTGFSLLLVSCLHMFPPDAPGCPSIKRHIGEFDPQVIIKNYNISSSIHLYK